MIKSKDSYKTLTLVIAIGFTLSYLMSLVSILRPQNGYLSGPSYMLFPFAIFHWGASERVFICTYYILFPLSLMISSIGMWKSWISGKFQYVAWFSVLPVVIFVIIKDAIFYLFDLVFPYWIYLWNAF